MVQNPARTEQSVDCNAVDAAEPSVQSQDVQVQSQDVQEEIPLEVSVLEFRSQFNWGLQHRV